MVTRARKVRRLVTAQERRVDEGIAAEPQNPLTSLFRAASETFTPIKKLTCEEGQVLQAGSSPCDDLQEMPPTVEPTSWFQSIRAYASRAYEHTSTQTWLHEILLASGKDTSKALSHQPRFKSAQWLLTFFLQSSAITFVLVSMLSQRKDLSNVALDVIRMVASVSDQGRRLQYLEAHMARVQEEITTLQHPNVNTICCGGAHASSSVAACRGVVGLSNTVPIWAQRALNVGVSQTTSMESKSGDGPVRANSVGTVSWNLGSMPDGIQIISVSRRHASSLWEKLARMISLPSVSSFTRTAQHLFDGSMPSSDECTLALDLPNASITLKVPTGTPILALCLHKRVRGDPSSAVRRVDVLEGVEGGSNNQAQEPLGHALIFEGATGCQYLAHTGQHNLLHLRFTENFGHPRYVCLDSLLLLAA